jgi:hypothetical protein
MGLSNLVEIAINNEECVVLKVKDNVKMDLIALGCFDGDETMFRITKGDQHTATIFCGDKHFSWDWGTKGSTLVGDKTRKCGKLIQRCVEEDFGIYLGKNINKIKQTLHIKTLEDKKNMNHKLEILYWPGKENKKCNIHKDGEHFKWFENLKNARNYISNNYKIQTHDLETAVTGCKVESYQVIS